ncbi:hypothetical protein [Paenibacillus spongiae]|uniref:Uncharacterized protein n=1 Tax=Paenibacillus spongiae TaxID=2909671 RepID=A0ABY5S2Z0_9BACL|nr:hypothetical protein [Paenibacillus spongiae]UVI28276.1 hypothetical protein L1F29_22865 [Paenibacillus spongiae]
MEQTWERQLQEIIKLCEEADIEEVILKELSSHIIPVPFLMNRHRTMAAIYRHMAESLREANIVFSINIIMLAGHSDGDVDAKYILPYQKFVGEDLRERHATYCLLDEDWQAYAADVCAMYAAAGPDKLFIDDDFRSLNHGVQYGCFCPIHVRRTAERCGAELTAESLMHAVSGTTPEHIRIKEAWMQINFEGQLAAARRMRAAVEQVNPLTRLGLMNSGEPAHSLQGRDMDVLLREFAGSRRPLSRPAGCSYSDSIHGDLFTIHQVMALSMSTVGEDIQIVSEVENYPHSRFTKSIRITKLQLELHALAGAEGFTLNLYDYLATPYGQEPDFLRLLIEEKERLETIQAARKGKRMVGFGLPWRKDTALHQVSRRGLLEDVMPNRDPDNYLPQFGIPVQFQQGKGNLIFGDAVQCYDEAEIMKLLAGGLMLDGLAFENLHNRGFGPYLGCKPSGFVDGFSVEQFGMNEFTGPFAGNLQTTNWSESKKQGKLPLHVHIAPDARAISMLMDDHLNELAPGVVLFENELGGRVALFTVPITSFQFLHRCRAYMVAKVAQWLMRESLPIWIEDCPNVGPIYYEGEDGEGLLGIISGNLDGTEVKLHTDLQLFDLFTDEAVRSIWMEPLSVRFFRTQKTL